MEDVKLFIGNLPESADEKVLQEKFSAYNPSSVILPPPKDGFARGFAFVTVKEAQVKAVLKDFLRQTIDGKQLRVTRAKADFSQRIKPTDATASKDDSNNASNEKKNVEMKFRTRSFQRGAQGTIHAPTTAQSKAFDSSSEEEDDDKNKVEDSDSSSDEEEVVDKNVTKIVEMSDASDSDSEEEEDETEEKEKTVEMSDSEDDQKVEKEVSTDDDDDSDDEEVEQKVEVEENVSSDEDDSDDEDEKVEEKNVAMSSDDDDGTDEDSDSEQEDSKVEKVDAGAVSSDDDEKVVSSDDESEVEEVEVEKEEAEVSSDDDEKSMADSEDDSDDDDEKENIPQNTKVDVKLQDVEVEELNKERESQASVLTRMFPASNVTVKKVEEKKEVEEEVSRPAYAGHLLQKRWVPPSSTASKQDDKDDSSDDEPTQVEEDDSESEEEVEKQEEKNVSDDSDSESEDEEAAEDKQEMTTKGKEDSSSSEEEEQAEQKKEVVTQENDDSSSASSSDEEQVVTQENDDSSSASSSDEEHVDDKQKQVEKVEVKKKQNLQTSQDSVAQALETLKVPLESLRPQPNTRKSDRKVELAQKIRKKVVELGQQAPEEKVEEEVEQNNNSKHVSGLQKEKSALERIATLKLQPDGSAIEPNGNVLSRKEYRALRSACKGARMGWKRQAAALARGAEQLKKAKAKEDEKKEKEEKKIVVRADVENAPVENAIFEVNSTFANVFREAVEEKFDVPSDKPVTPASTPPKEKPTVGLTWLQKLRQNANKNNEKENVVVEEKQIEETVDVTIELPNKKRPLDSNNDEDVAEVWPPVKKVKKARKPLIGFFKTDASAEKLDRKRDKIAIDSKNLLRQAKRKKKIKVM